jgi:thiamine biosynthesis lipoprotein
VNHLAAASDQTRPNRRRFLRILAVAGAGGLTWGLAWRRRRDHDRPLTMTRQLMGTVVNLTIAGYDHDAALAAASDCLGRMADLESVLSRFRPDSQVSRLNRDGRVDDADPALVDLVSRSATLSELTAGAFDITVEPVLRLYHERSSQGLPATSAIEQALSRVDWRRLQVGEGSVRFIAPGMALTMDGIAKGYIVDAGVEVLHRHGLTDVMVEAGGDLLAVGKRSAQRPWRLAIAPPRSSMSGATPIIELSNQAVATSGDSLHPFSPDYRHHHILDPARGYSSPDLASATVVAPDVTTADALATAMMVLTPDAALALTSHFPESHAYLVTKELDAVQTPSFPFA